MNSRRSDRAITAAVIGGGPAGLMAAEALVAGGARVDVYDRMPSVGRKFLMAGKGGLNLTHSEAFEPFLSRYGPRADRLRPMLESFGPADLREWARDLGVETFAGSSGRVFPAEMKAAPLLRAWLHRLRETGVKFHVRHRWRGWTQDGELLFESNQGERRCRPDAVVLALGGGSWARLGSDAGWVSVLERGGIRVAPLRPANCGFDIGWSDHFRNKFAGHPLKTIVASFTDRSGSIFRQQGECIVTDTGIEGGVVYALSAPLRDEIDANGSALLHLDLLPGRDLWGVEQDIAHPRGSRSLSSHLQSRLGLKGVKSGLLREVLRGRDFESPVLLASALKALPLRLIAPRPIDEAISTAGGVPFEEMDERLMLQAQPGVFCAGEMLDWEAPTGGYLLTACLASGRTAGNGAISWLDAAN
ncbi:MAG TPA: TIGR03862 family flavoprotein [Burkholderiales bacterium]